MPGSPIAALNNPHTLTLTVDRGTLDDTFNFQLPSSWRSGNIALSGYATNSSTFTFPGGAKTFQFIQANPMHVTIVPIAYTCSSGGSGTYTPHSPYAYLTDYTFRTYPVPFILTSTHVSLSYSGPCASEQYDSGPAPTWNDMGNILDLVASAWRSDGSPDSYYYGLTPHTGMGVGAFPDPVAAGAESSELHAHEVGHNHGRPHAPGCNAAYPDPSFPYVVNVSGDLRGYIGDSAHPNYGFDIKTQAIYSYTKYTDIMGYCGPKWISDYTYKALLAYD